MNGYDQPQEVGADRLLAAFAARKLFSDSPSIISVDFGTATTFDCVSGNTYLGGLICPGLFSSRNALASGLRAAPWKQAEFDAPLFGSFVHDVLEHVVRAAQENGGFAAMTEGLCDRLKAQLPGPTLVVGTGGAAHDLSRICRAFDIVRPDLILEGLRLLWNRNGAQALS